jgi:hypothetical protein|tara:strand:- start:542 stop:931 length:390 start_codon:yes stop_codon:yes gene_type:complete
MADAVIFSDIMAHLVSRLNTELTTQGYTNTRVGILADDTTSQVIIRRDGGSRNSKTIMSSVIGVNIYESSYATAEGLALMVEAIFDDLPNGTPIVATSVQSSIQDVTDLSGERRFLRFAVTHRGSNLTN